MADNEHRSRRDQQRDLISARLHPLSLLGPELRLHPTAPVDGLDEHSPGARCGSCGFRRRLKLTGAQTYPKCTYPTRHRTGSGPVADVRAWWPACKDYKPRAAGGDRG